MSGRHHGNRPFRPPGCRPPSQPPFELINPNFSLQDPNLLQFLQAFTTPIQPNFPLQQNPDNSFFRNPNNHSLPPNPNNYFLPPNLNNCSLPQNPNNYSHPQNPDNYSLPQIPNFPTKQQQQQVFNNPGISQSQPQNQRGTAASRQVRKEVRERAEQAVKQALHQIPYVPAEQQQQVFNNPSSSQSQPQNQRGTAASRQVQKGVRERAEQAVKQAWREHIASGKSVSAWKVSNAALLALQADSWKSLGLNMDGIPSLKKLLTVEERVNAFLQCFVGVWTITTLYELEMAICENEGVRTFEELELGPLLCHPFVLRHFSVNSNTTEVFKITSEDIIVHLHEYMDSHKNQEILIDEFLDFVADKQAVASKEKLGVRIRSLTMQTSFIMKAERKKDFKVKKCQKGLKQKKSSEGLKLKERYINVSKQVESFISAHKDFCGKHMRFDLSSSEDEGSNDCPHEDARTDNDEGNESKLPSPVISRSDWVSTCPYPSATEELSRLGLKDGMNKPSPATGSSRHNDCIGPDKRKRKNDSRSPSFSRPTKLSRKDEVKQNVTLNENGNDAKEFSNLDETDFSLSDNSMKTFITTWKEACREHTMEEV